MVETAGVEADMAEILPSSTDFTSPVSSRTAGKFKRPLAPLALVSDTGGEGCSPSKPPVAKRHRRALYEGRKTASSPAIADKAAAVKKEGSTGSSKPQSLSRSMSMLNPAEAERALKKSAQFAEACAKLSDDQSNLTADTR